MNLRNGSLLALPLAALALCATFAAPGAAQRGGESGGQNGRQTPPTRQARPAQQRPQQQRPQQSARPTDRAKEAKQDQRQDRRAAAARGAVRPYEVRSGQLRARMDAGGNGAELQRGMLGEVNVNRDRNARIQRLRRIFEARKDERQLRRLDQLQDSETRRYRNLMSQARGRMSEDEYRRFLDRAGDPALAGPIEASEEQRQTRKEGGQ